MSEFLVRYEKFDSKELASQMHELVNDNVDLLVARNLMGVVSRYGSGLELAEEKIKKGQKENGLNDANEVGHYAIVGTSGDVVGAASVTRGIQLKKLRLPIPSGLAKGPLSMKYPHANPNIHAWADGEETESLAFAYAHLANENFKEKPYYIFGYNIFENIVDYPWTIEPTKSPSDIHDAITAFSGLRALVSKRFDDGESNRDIPSISTLYAPAREEKELKRGTLSFSQVLNFDPVSGYLDY